MVSPKVVVGASKLSTRLARPILSPPRLQDGGREAAGGGDGHCGEQWALPSPAHRGRSGSTGERRQQAMIQEIK